MNKGMRCRRHPCEPGPGVCATCLRDRLLAVIEARDGRRSTEHRPNVLPTPLAPCHIHRFFSTPQVNPTYKTCRKSSLFPNLFGNSKSDEIRSSRSWISKLLNRKKKSKESESVYRFKNDRGMSPARGVEDSCSSGYSTDGSIGWRRAEPTPVRRFNNNSTVRVGRGVSGFAFCLSPLVRPNSATVVGEDLRGPCRSQIKKHVSDGSVGVGVGLVHSGSRKLADYGRFR